MTQLTVPYFSQRDNTLNPSGSCNVTSIAMALSHLGIRGDGSFPQLEDQMYQRCLDRGFDRHSPFGLKSLVESYLGCKDDFTEYGTLAAIRKALDEGKPCVVHSYLTGFGHVICVIGYDANGFIVNDPWGEWSPWEYASRDGAGKHYSNRCIAACCDSFSQGEAMDRYPRMSSAEAEKCSQIWLHRISRP